MLISLKHSFLFFLLSCCLNGFCQDKKETIYILFNKQHQDTCWKFNTNSIIFSLKDHEVVKQQMHQLNFFLHNPDTQDKKIIKYSEIKNKLISGIQAVEKADNYLKKYQPYKFKTPFYYNNYFEKIYLFEKLNDTEGVLYEVSWNWGVN